MTDPGSPPRPRTLPLGTWLASRGFVPAFGIALATLGTLASVAAAWVAGRAGGEVVARLPVIESTAMAWGAGALIAFGASYQALRRDRDQGITALVRVRGASPTAYVRGRVGGVVMLLAATVGGGTLMGGAAAVAVARPVAPVLWSALGGLGYALAFAATVGPVAMATLGHRTRGGGLALLLAVLLAPELVAPWTATFLPRGWHELTSIPAALAAVRDGIASPIERGESMARALAGLTAVVAMSLVIVAARVRARAELR